MQHAWWTGWPVHRSTFNIRLRYGVWCKRPVLEIFVRPMRVEKTVRSRDLSDWFVRPLRVRNFKFKLAQPISQLIRLIRSRMRECSIWSTRLTHSIFWAPRGSGPPPKKTSCRILHQNVLGLRYGVGSGYLITICFCRSVRRVFKVGILPVHFRRFQFLPLAGAGPP